MTTIYMDDPSPELAAALAEVAEGEDCVIEAGGRRRHHDLSR